MQETLLHFISTSQTPQRRAIFCGGTSLTNGRSDDVAANAVAILTIDKASL